MASDWSSIVCCFDVNFYWCSYFVLVSQQLRWRGGTKSEEKPYPLLPKSVIPRIKENVSGDQRLNPLESVFRCSWIRYNEVLLYMHCAVKSWYDFSHRSYFQISTSRSRRHIIRMLSGILLFVRQNLWLELKRRNGKVSWFARKETGGFGLWIDFQIWIYCRELSSDTAVNALAITEFESNAGGCSIGHLFSISSAVHVLKVRKSIYGENLFVKVCVCVCVYVHVWGLIKG